MNQSEYSTFSLKNDSFVGLITGALHLDENDEFNELVILDSDLFKNFIKNEVNIKQILQQGTSVDNLPTYEALKTRIYDLLTKIVIKVNIDRGTPQNNIETPSVVASGIQGISSAEILAARERREKLKEQGIKSTPSLTLNKPLSERTMEIRSSPGYESSENEVTSSISSSSLRRGGNFSRKQKRKNNYKKTRKTNKKTRKTNKKTRKTNKKTRKTNKKTRKTNKKTRKSNKKTRKI